MKSLSNKLKEFVINTGNPIDSINFKGCMGFFLGDSKEFVLSRIEHLELMNEEEKESLDNDFFLYGSYSRTDIIRTSCGLFNNIKKISFFFNGDLLNSIHIDIFPQQTDISNLIDIIKQKIINNVGKPEVEVKNAASWIGKNSIININQVNNEYYVAVGRY